MTVGEWLTERTPVPPAPLAARLRETLGDHLRDRAGNAHYVMLTTAEGLLAELLTLDGAARDRALDLLAVDALVTYAFEAACESPDTLRARATDAMSAIASLAAQVSRA
ncbi:MAG TPA: hypothetical protein VN717_06475 [Gemmatimonadaceae bacterium]|nr:hypothetical protein [Gemmatimonadaceae bacterium]